MNTKIDYQIHDVLIRTLKSPFETVEEIKKLFTKYIDEFGTYEDKVIELIEKYTGYPFTIERIPVYLVPISRNSVPFSNAKSSLEENTPGVVLKVFPDILRNHHIFIHELVHINQWHNHEEFNKSRFFINEDGTKNEDGIELCADIVALYIVRDIFGKNSEVENNFWDFLENTNEKNKRKYDILQKYLPQWDLLKKPQKEYIFL